MLCYERLSLFKMEVLRLVVTKRKVSIFLEETILCYLFYKKIIRGEFF